MIKLLHGDCLELGKEIESGSVDFILTDLPYGNMKGAELDGWGGDRTAWDIAIDPKKVYEIAKQSIAKEWENGSIQSRTLHNKVNN